MVRRTCSLPLLMVDVADPPAERVLPLPPPRALDDDDALPRLLTEDEDDDFRLKDLGSQSNDFLGRRAGPVWLLALPDFPGLGGGCCCCWEEGEAERPFLLKPPLLWLLPLAGLVE